MLDRIVFNKLKTRIEKFGILPSIKSGFRSGYSTDLTSGSDISMVFLLLNYTTMEFPQELWSGLVCIYLIVTSR